MSPSSNSGTGYLLINLGTPDSSSTSDVRRYLNQFLMDPYVLDTPWLFRRLIVSLFILPFRPKQSAHAYASIWSDEGSPLLIHSQALRDALQKEINGPVELAMRYGKPDIRSAVESLQSKADHIVVIPLYPQYADSTVTTSLQAVREAAKEAANDAANADWSVLAPFFAKPEFITPLAEQVRSADGDWDHLLMSYHGLPERHITRTDPTGSHCLREENCCAIPSSAHATCYRHQVYATSTALADSLGLERDQYTVSFQSRLGRLPWLQPYTDQVLSELPQKGVKRLAVTCPAFVADNLETLEEIGIQGRETFLEAGGEDFQLIPCLNDDASWVTGLSSLIRSHMSAASSETSL